MTTYIAGPMTGIDEFNFPAFHAEAARQRGLGYEVINPAELDAEVGPDHLWDFHLRRDLKVLSDCDRVVLLPGWEHSKGARLEHHVATELGMVVVFPDE